MNASKRRTDPSVTSDDLDQAFDLVVSRHMALFDGYPRLQAFYNTQDDAYDRFGVPAGAYDDGPVVSVRLQRASLQLWKIDVPAAMGIFVVANGGDLANERLWRRDAMVPSDVAAAPGA